MADREKHTLMSIVNELREGILTVRVEVFPFTGEESINIHIPKEDIPDYQKRIIVALNVINFLNQFKDIKNIEIYFENNG